MAPEPEGSKRVAARAVAAIRLCEDLQGAIARTAERSVEGQPMALRASGLADVLALTSALMGTVAALAQEMDVQAAQEVAMATEPVAQG